MNLLDLVLVAPAGRLSDRAADSARRTQTQPAAGRWSSRWSTFVASLGLLAWFRSRRGRRAVRHRRAVDRITRTFTCHRRHRRPQPLAVLLSTFLTPICVLISWNSIDKRVKEFFAFLLLLEFGLVGVFLALGSVPVLRVLGSLRWCRCTS